MAAIPRPFTILAGGTSVAGPSGGVSTDNAIVRWDGTSGRIIQNSVVTIDDTTGAMTWVGQPVAINAGGSNQNITLTPSGTTGLIGLGSAPVAGWIVGLPAGNIPVVVAGLASVASNPYLTIYDSRTLAADTGGGISFSANTRSAGNGYAPRELGYIRAGKINAADNDDGGYLAMVIRNPLGTGFAEALRITNNGSASVPSALFGTSTNSSNGRLQLATHTTIAGGIGFGTDTSWSRIASGKLAITGTGSASAILLYEGATEAGHFTTASGVTFIGSSSSAALNIRVNNTTAIAIDTSLNATGVGYLNGSQVRILPKTQAASPYSVSATVDNRTAMTNEGATSLVTFTLPTAVANLDYSFYIQDADGLRITANTGDTIRFSATVTAAAGSITSTTVGSSIRLYAINATEWVATSLIGTWA